MDFFCCENKRVQVKYERRFILSEFYLGKGESGFISEDALLCNRDPKSSVGSRENYFLIGYGAHKKGVAMQAGTPRIMMWQVLDCNEPLIVQLFLQNSSYYQANPR